MKKILDENKLDQVLHQMADQIIGYATNLEQSVLVGIRTRGAFLADRLETLIRQKSGVEVPVGILDITLYRDDLSRLSDHPLIRQTTIPCAIDGSEVFLVDDVLFTGRTIRAALDALFDFGRPSKIGLVTLVDRNGRELPIQADIVGLRYESKPGDNVKVHLKEVDGMDGIDVLEGR